MKINKVISLMKNYYHCGGMPRRINDRLQISLLRRSALLSSIRNSHGEEASQFISNNINSPNAINIINTYARENNFSNDEIDSINNYIVSEMVRQNRDQLENNDESDNESDNESDESDNENINNININNINNDDPNIQRYYNYLNQQDEDEEEEDNSSEDDELNHGFIQQFEEGLTIRDIWGDVATIIRYDPNEDTYQVSYEDGSENMITEDEIEGEINPEQPDEVNNEEYRLDLQPDNETDDETDNESEEELEQNQDEQNLFLNNLGESIPVPDDTDEIVTCSVCMVNKPSVAFVNCGHVAVCPNCARRLVDRNDLNCPICREPINGFLRLFFPSGDLKRGGYIFKNLK